jgi:hypothetical protein
MEFDIRTIKNKSIAILQSDKILIRDIHDALDLMAEAGTHDSGSIIISERNLDPAFFDLKSGIAGEILQKFSTYGVQLTIFGDFSKYKSKSLRDFIFESNKYRHINFVNDLDEAMTRLTGK